MGTDTGLPTVEKARGHAVVVVEDDQTLGGILQELLQDEGYDVHVQPRWDQAYRVIADVRPAAVLLDVRLDGEERGWEVLDALMADPMTRSIPVVLSSAGMPSVRLNQARLVHGVHVLPKPFVLETLLALLHDLGAMPQARAERESNL